MLRKRSRGGSSTSNQSRGHLMAADSASDPPKSRSSSFFNIPGLLVGLCSKGLPDYEPARSPTSPLELRTFSSLGSPLIRSPRSPGLEGGQIRSWGCSRVGLGLLDCLADDTMPAGKLLSVSLSKNLLFGSQVKINTPSPQTHLDSVMDARSGTDPESFPKDLEISSSPYRQLGCCGATGVEPSAIKSNSEGKHLNDVLGSPSISMSSSYGLVDSLSASEIESSEDYTCIICHGPNPKTTHIFGDRILESHIIQSPFHDDKFGEARGRSSWFINCSKDSPIHPSGDFLSFCFTCKKKLEGEDIYIYRGEKAFCSCTCRDQEISVEEEMMKPTTTPCDPPPSYFEEEIYIAGTT